MIRTLVRRGTALLWVLPFLAGRLYAQDAEHDLDFIDKLMANGFSDLAQPLIKKLERDSNPQTKTQLELFTRRAKKRHLEFLIRSRASSEEILKAAEEAEKSLKEYSDKNPAHLESRFDWLETTVTKAQILAKKFKSEGGDNFTLSKMAFRMVLDEYKNMHEHMGPPPDTDSLEEEAYVQKDLKIRTNWIMTYFFMLQELYYDNKDFEGLKSIFQNEMEKLFGEMKWQYENRLSLYELALYVGDIQMLLTRVSEPERREANFLGALQKYQMTAALADRKEDKGSETLRSLSAEAYLRIVRANNAYAQLKKQASYYQRAIDAALTLFKKFPQFKDKEDLFLEVQLELALAYGKLNRRTEAQQYLDKLYEKGESWKVKVQRVSRELGWGLSVPKMIESAIALMDRGRDYQALSEFRSIINSLAAENSKETRAFLAECYYRMGLGYINTTRWFEALAALTQVEQYKAEARQDILNKTAQKRMDALDKVATLTGSKEDEKAANNFMDYLKDAYPEVFANAGLEMRLLRRLSDQNKWKEAAELATKLLKDRKSTDPAYEELLWTQGLNAYKYAQSLLPPLENEKEAAKKQAMTTQATEALKSADRALYDYRLFLSKQPASQDKEKQRLMKEKEAFSAFYRAWMNALPLMNNAKTSLQLLSDFDQYFKLEGFAKRYPKLPGNVFITRITAYATMNDFDHAAAELKRLEDYLTANKLPHDPKWNAWGQLAKQLDERAKELLKSDPKKAKQYALQSAEYVQQLIDLGRISNPDMIRSTAEAFLEAAEASGKKDLYKKAADMLRAYKFKIAKDLETNPSLAETLERYIARCHTKQGEYDAAAQFYTQITNQDPKKTKVYLWIEFAEFWEDYAVKRKEEGSMEDFMGFTKRAIDIYGELVGILITVTKPETKITPEQRETGMGYYFKSMYKWFHLQWEGDWKENVKIYLPRYKEAHSENNVPWSQAAPYKDNEGHSYQELLNALEQKLK